MQRGVTDRNTGDAGVDGPKPRAVPRPVCGPSGAGGRTRVPVGHSERGVSVHPAKKPRKTSLGLACGPRVPLWAWPDRRNPGESPAWGASLDHLFAGAHGSIQTRKTSGTITSRVWIDLQPARSQKKPAVTSCESG